MYIERTPLKGSEEALLDYWQQHLHDWPIGKDRCLAETRAALKHLWLYSAYEKGRCCGLLVNEEGVRNAIWLLHVTPDKRRQGIGSALLDSALSNVKGVWTAGLGTGYWWQGVPEGCGDDFLEHRGFSWSWTSIDMLLSLGDWRYDESLQILGNPEITKLDSSDVPGLMDMLSQEPDLTGWTPFYENMIQAEQLHRIFISRVDGLVVGCVLVLDEGDIRWNKRFPGQIGGIGCLGVARQHRGKGIGLALAASVTKELQENGFDYSYVGYTWLEEWYGKLGYRTIFRQKMGELKTGE